MVEGRCSKRFPKAFADETIVPDSSYPIYRRRMNDRFVTRNRVELHNGFVVPYSPYLCRRYNAHINVEVSGSVHVFKYIYKYIYKGPDRATVELAQRSNEVKEYRDSRYVSAPEACWRIFNLKMHDRYPAVVRLQIHLPGQQMVRFREDEHLNDIVERGEMQNTMLLAFFERNRQSAEEAVANGAVRDSFFDSRRILYQDFPQRFT